MLFMTSNMALLAGEVDVSVTAAAETFSNSRCFLPVSVKENAGCPNVGDSCAEL